MDPISFTLQRHWAELENDLSHGEDKGTHKAFAIISGELKRHSARYSPSAQPSDSHFSCDKHHRKFAPRQIPGFMAKSPKSHG